MLSLVIKAIQLIIVPSLETSQESDHRYQPIIVLSWVSVFCPQLVECVPCAKDTHYNY